MVGSRYRVPAGCRGSELGQAEVDALTELVRSSGPLSAGSSRLTFERRFAKHVGTRHALTVTSGTVALEIAIGLLELRTGDEVIVTPQTYQATVQPLLDYPVEVRFCDVDPESLNMDPAVLETLLTERTRAVVLVHYGGYPADMERIMQLARDRGVVVIEDCAHALGAERAGRRPGSMADIGCFSFHGSKNITTLGEGGMLTLDRDDWAERIDRRRSNDVDGDFRAVSSELTEPAALPWMKYAAHVYRQTYAQVRRAGTNATMSEAAAAVGLVQLAKLDALVDRRRAIAAQLDEVLTGFGEVRVPRPPSGTRHAYHLYTFFVRRPGARDELVRALDRRGVEVQLRYFPQHLLPEWNGHGHGLGECPVTERLWFDEHVNLPCHPGLAPDQVDELAEILAESLREVLAGTGTSTEEIHECPTST